MSESSLRVMADSNIIIAGVLKPRWFFEFLVHALRGDFQLVLAPQTVAEILKWTEKRQKHPKRVIEFFLVASRFELAPDPTPDEVKAQSHLVRDATDVPIALSAIKAGVDYLVTNDQDFHNEHAKVELEKEGIRVLLVGTFLADVLHWNSENLEAIRQRDWPDLLP